MPPFHPGPVSNDAVPHRLRKSGILFRPRWLFRRRYTLDRRLSSLAHGTKFRARKHPMFESFGFETLTAPQAAICLGVVLGLAFGALAQVTRFCLRRALWDPGDERRPALGVWLAALAAAVDRHPGRRRHRADRLRRSPLHGGRSAGSGHRHWRAGLRRGHGADARLRLAADGAAGHRQPARADRAAGLCDHRACHAQGRAGAAAHQRSAA